MKNLKTKVGTGLALIVVCTFIWNLGFVYILSEYSGDSSPEKLDGLRAEIEQGEIEVSKELYLSSLSSMKKFAVASDNLVNLLLKSINLLAVLNVIFVALLSGLFWLTIRNYKKDEEP